MHPNYLWLLALSAVVSLLPAGHAQRKLEPGQVSRLVTLDVDGRDLRTVFETTELIEAPNWSPDGKWLVFNGGGGLFRVPADGSAKPEKIDLGPVRGANNDHVLSPDGRTIYFSARGHIYAVPFEGGQPRRVSNEHPADQPFTYWLHGVSPDGKTLVYTGARQIGEDRWARVDIWTIPAAGGADVALTNDTVYDDGPEYSPDGEWIYFNSERAATQKGHAQIFRMRTDGSGVEQLTRDERVNWFPHLSPDGRWVVYLSYPPGTEGHPANKDVILRRMRLDGSERRDLIAFTGGQGTINVPSWSPDSRRFGFVMYPRAGEQPRLGARTVLGAQGERFTLNDRPEFLLGISYYGALGASEAFIAEDLRDVRAHGVNWIRVWANWAGHEAFDAEGKPRSPQFEKLRALVARCDELGLLVDVTLTTGPWRTLSPERRDAARRVAVEALVRGLQPWRNWYLDLANERNNGGANHVALAEVRALRERVRELAPTLLVTASHWEDMSAADVAAYVRDAGVDFLTPHGDRTREAARVREERTRDYRTWIAATGRVIPLHYQEPLRRDFRYKEAWNPSADDILADLRAAQRGGAAGWCFHNGRNDFAADKRPGRSFDLTELRLFAQLDAEERRVLAALGGHLSAPGGEDLAGIRR